MTTLILDSSPLEPPAPKSLDSDQLRVVAHRAGALRVLAGPGTGKTTTLVKAMAGRLSGEDPLTPDQVLGLTFGRRAALEWRDQVTQEVGGGVVPLVSTFHSFCYALLRKFAANEAYEIATRLLSGPEQQVRAQQLFTASIADGRLNWPADVMPAVPTRGLAEEIRTVMSRTRSHLMDPQDLSELGKATGRPMWDSIGQFMDEYLDVLGFEGVLDYSELIYRAVLLATKPEVSKYLQDTFSAIYVDEYQDTDPGQVELLKHMVNASSSLVIVGDVDQAIYGFRGADESGIRRFKEQFEPIFGNNIQDVVLSTCRRFGPRIRTAASAVIGDRVPSGFDKASIMQHRSPTCVSTTQGEVLVKTYDSDGAQASHIADTIARAHAHEGRAWSDMAVIVRSAVMSLPAIYRALVTAGIPVEVAADDIPLAQDPAIAPLMVLMRTVDDESTITGDVALGLLTGPLVRLDPVDLRRFGRYLREQDRREDRIPRSSSLLIAHALAQPGEIVDVVPGQHSAVARGISELGQLIRDARLSMRSGATPHEVLWQLWNGTQWPQTLQRQALGYGTSSARAHRDLDAICSLFDQANRFVARGRGKDLTIFLDEIASQMIPAEALADNDLRSDTVRLITAHRAKGLQWPFVIVAGAQEDLWPNLKVANTLLQANRIGRREVLMPETPQEILASERRLFYVAVTRAQEKLLITAVDEDQSEKGEAVSRFVTDIVNGLGDIVTSHEPGRPKSPLSAEGVIARLRRVLDDPAMSQVHKEAAAHRLAQLADSGLPAFASADPRNWWGTRVRTTNEKTISEPIHLSGTMVTSIETCPAAWFLENKVKAKAESQTRMLFGTALHAIAEGLEAGQIETTVEDIARRLDRLWPGLGFDTTWESEYQRSQAHLASVRLLSWFIDHSQVRSVAESDLSMRASLPTPSGGTIEVSITGRADRIEFQANGVVIYDYKTGKSAVKSAELPRNLQLALYAFMIENGTYTENGEIKSLPDGEEVSGAALIHLRLPDAQNPEYPSVQQVAKDSHDAKSKVTLNDRLVSAAQIVLDERYEARYEVNRCSRCAVRFLCPAAPEGRQVL